VHPLTEGPLHEAFLSPRKDLEPTHISKTPPQPITERPGVDPPSADAEWIDGYWEWDPGRKDFVWVTGTWRVPPPGRFWVNGYWKRDQAGWYRVPGFWSDRKTDRLDYRKSGPPEDHPEDDPGEPPAPDCFYVPGHYSPDGDGVAWKKGFWAKAQPGWAWVPSQWVRQPEGWVYQEGYWDRTLEDRGTLFAPAQVSPSAKPGGDLTYQPYSQVSPEMYGQLYGAFGRPSSQYDGYPGVYYDEDGRFYGYADYGTLGGYYGYLDYPYYGGYGYPYISTPVSYGYDDGGYPYYGLGLCSGVLGGAVGFGGWGGLGWGGWGGLGWGGWGGLGWGGWGGFGGLGWGGLGWGGWGGPGWGGWGMPLWGFPVGWGGWGAGGWGLGLGFGGWGLGLGWGFPFWGGFGWGNPFWGGWGWGGWGWGGWNRWSRNFPFNPGRNFGGRGVGGVVQRGLGGGVGGVGGRNGGLARGAAGLGGGASGSMLRGRQVQGLNRGGAAGLASHRGVQAPPSSHPFGNPFRQGQLTQSANRTGGQGQIQRTSSSLASGNAFRPAFNGVNSATMRHTSARPSFNTGAMGTGAANRAGPINAASGPGQGLNMGRGMAGGIGQPSGAQVFRGGNPAQGMAGQGFAPGQGFAQRGLTGGGLANPGQVGGMVNPGQLGGMTHQGFAPQAQSFAPSQGFSGGFRAPSMPSYGGMRYGGGTMGGGFGGGFRGSGFSGGFGGGHMGGGGGGHR
jgi:hypothetical protein